MRPCFLILDQACPGNISTRKLVIETAKFNVITAYHPDEAIESLRRFPNVDGIVIDSHTEKPRSGELIDELHTVRPDIPIVTVSPGGNDPCGKENFHVSAFDPSELLNALSKISLGVNYRWGS